MLEADIEAKFRDAVKAAGGKAFKFISPGNSGVPDRLVVLPGNRIGFVELKQKGKKPSVLQTKQLNWLRSRGCTTAVLDKTEDIPAVIEMIQGGET